MVVRLEQVVLDESRIDAASESGDLLALPGDQLVENRFRGFDVHGSRCASMIAFAFAANASAGRKPSISPATRPDGATKTSIGNPATPLRRARGAPSCSALW